MVLSSLAAVALLFPAEDLRAARRREANEKIRVLAELGGLGSSKE